MQSFLFPVPQKIYVCIHQLLPKLLHVSHYRKTPWNGGLGALGYQLPLEQSAHYKVCLQTLSMKLL